MVACLFLVALVAGVAATPAARAQAHGSRIRIVTIVAHNNAQGTKFWFTMSQRMIPTGYVEFHFVNAGTVSHEAQLFRITQPGFTEAQLVQALMGPPHTGAGPAPFVAAGGAASIVPGRSQDVIHWVRPGHYVIVCFDTGPNGNTPHVFLGMHLSFWVDDDASAPADVDDATDDGVPVSSGVIILKNFQIIVPSVMHEAGAMTLRVVNLGPDTHQMALVKVPMNITRQDVINALHANGPPSFPTTDMGGIDAIAPHTPSWVELNLQPGKYVALCFVPDEHGVPHAIGHDMFTIFAVER